MRAVVMHILEAKRDVQILDLTKESSKRGAVVAHFIGQDLSASAVMSKIKSLLDKAPDPELQAVYDNLVKVIEYNATVFPELAEESEFK